jgi:transcriptional regulator with PAS, ATPase and Fis domain
VTDQTIDDVSSIAVGEQVEPGIVIVASGRTARHVVLSPPAELGRRMASSGATIHEIDDERMSRDHATVRYARGGWTIADRDSRNGTHVDGERITAESRRRGTVVVRLGQTLCILVEHARGHAGPDRAPSPGALVVGPELARAFADVERAAASGDSVLVHGESGAGKELAARRFHDASRRSKGPFVAVNCATIPEGVAERLLFGAKKGAFSGAIDALGHFQMAAGGTLFLDEVAELEPAVQAKLLRVLETREVQPVGASSATAIDVGIVAASHRELRAAVAGKAFRDDLYYRLARVTVQLPALRDRKVDIARLVQRELAALEGGLAPHTKLLEACCLRAWPGNVRELVAAVRQAAETARAAGRDVVRVEDLAEHAGASFDRVQGETALERPGVAPAALDKPAVEAALVRANGVVSVAARALGLHRTQLYRLLDKLGIARGPAEE